MSATRIWQGIEAQDPPYLRNDYRDLLAMAEQLRDTRREKFPALIAAGKIAADEAARQLAVFDDIAADWHWICTGEGEPAPYISIHDRRDALDTSIATIAGIAARRGGFDDELEHQAQCLIALRWHLEPPRGLGTHHLARLTHDCRRDAAARRETAHA